MADKKEIVLSGIRSTGNLHLGNYYGALSKFVRMQDDYDCNFFIADLHALTTNPDPRELHANVKNILAEYLAAGIDPEKSTIFIQSDVPEIAEMYLLLNMHVGIGELMRTASFKDKARKALGIGVPAQGDDDEAFEKEIIGAATNKRVNAGLLTYPTLMAVDILIQKATKVPVGKDQEQHLELTRRFARRFNSYYGAEVFPEPYNFDFGGKPVKVPGLDGSGKMGKSEGNCIYLIDDPKALRKKVMRATTNRPLQQRRRREAGGGASELAYAHHVAHLCQCGGGALAGAFGTLSHHTAQVCVVGQDVVDAVAYGSCDGEDVLGELLFQVAVANGAVGVSVAEVLHHIGCTREFEQREQVGHRFTHR